MKRALTVMAIAAVAVSLSTVAADWTELEWAASIVTDSKTGGRAIIFSTGLAYEEKPETAMLSITWEVYRMEGNSEMLLYEYARTATTVHQSTYFSSEPVVIEPGFRYGARVQVEDSENALSYKRTFSHIEPASLPVGLRFVGWDGTEEADLVVMPDTDIQELVLLQSALASYEVIAEDVTIDTFFSQHATKSGDYPASVVLLPDTGVHNNWGSDSKPITVTFGLAVLTFSITSLDARNDFQHQIDQYDQSFVGTVYAGPNEDGLSEGVIIFVHDALDVMFDAAVEELASRND